VSLLAVLATESITWVKVDRPVFDLVGVVLNSFGMAAICAGVALFLGTALGLGFIVRDRRTPADLRDPLSLYLLKAPPH
jgi:hypothetical protein